MKKPIHYEIDSFDKLINVTSSKNFEFISKDLIMWLLYTVKFLEDVRKENPKTTKGKSNSDLCKVSFIWIDDGKNDMKSVTLKNKLTGEIKKFSIK